MSKTYDAMIEVICVKQIKVVGLPSLDPQDIMEALDNNDFDDIIDEDILEYTEVVSVTPMGESEDEDEEEE